MYLIGTQRTKGIHKILLPCWIAVSVISRRCIRTSPERFPLLTGPVHKHLTWLKFKVFIVFGVVLNRIHMHYMNIISTHNCIFNYSQLFKYFVFMIYRVLCIVLLCPFLRATCRTRASPHIIAFLIIPILFGGPQYYVCRVCFYCVILVGASFMRAIHRRALHNNLILHSFIYVLLLLLFISLYNVAIYFPHTIYITLQIPHPQCFIPKYFSYVCVDDAVRENGKLTKNHALYPLNIKEIRKV